MYLITRSDLSPGIQTAQCAHAMAELCRVFPSEMAHWHTASNNVVCLMAATEVDLAGLAAQAHSAAVPVVCFFEPDLGDAMTAIGVVVDGSGRRMFANLPLSGRRAHYPNTCGS